MEQDNLFLHTCFGVGVAAIGEIGTVALIIARDYIALSPQEYSDAFIASFCLAGGGLAYSAIALVSCHYSKPNSHSPQIPPKESNLEKKLQ